MAAEIRQFVLAQGFECVGITTPDAIAGAPAGLAEYLSRGWHGDMVWMENRAEERASPLVLWPEVRSIIMLGLNYTPEENPLLQLKHKANGLISAYAQGVDYHDVIKPRLKLIAQALIKSAGGGAAKVFVDTAPVMEKPLAAAAGLGWQGKHSVLVSRRYGSWLFLGVIFTNIDLLSDKPHPQHCGSCTRCLDICPTNAFPAPYKLDSRRCIAYLTIEHKGPIGREFRALLGNRIYGCDDCLAICPWNRFAATSRDVKLTARRDIGLRPLVELLRLDDAAFRLLFAKTPVKRTGRARFIRNCLIAAGNSGDATLVPAVRQLLSDPEPLVRGAAIWALGRLDRVLLRSEWARMTTETDPDVRREWMDEGVMGEA